MSTVKTYLATLLRIPDDIVLAIAAQDFDESLPTRCICGWALRESIARAANRDPASIGRQWNGSTTRECQRRFGGRIDNWWDLFSGAAIDTPAVETAFADRLDIACGGTPVARERERAE